MITATIRYEDKNAALHLQEIFSYENKTFPNQRASYEIKINDSLIIQAKAKDSVALRAVLNTITKIITTYENTSEVIHDAGRNTAIDNT